MSLWFGWEGSAFFMVEVGGYYFHYSKSRSVFLSSGGIKMVLLYGECGRVLLSLRVEMGGYCFL